MPWGKKKNDKGGASAVDYRGGANAEDVPLLLVENNIPVWRQLGNDAPLYEDMMDESHSVTYDELGRAQAQSDDAEGTEGYMTIEPCAYQEPEPVRSEYLDVQPPSQPTVQQLDRDQNGRLSASDFAGLTLSDSGPADVNADNVAGLPPGWELATTADGRPYYLNHANKTTSWIRPQAGDKPNIGDYIPLPAGWEYKPQPRPHFLDHNTQTSHNEDPRPLPEGWSQRVSNTGVAFFVNHADKRTQWYHPCGQHQADAIEPKTDDQGRTYYLNHDTKESSWDNPLLRPGFFGARGAGLPVGVERKFTEDGKLYFIDHRTKLTSWTQPAH